MQEIKQKKKRPAEVKPSTQPKGGQVLKEKLLTKQSGINRRKKKFPPDIRGTYPISNCGITDPTSRRRGSRSEANAHSMAEKAQSQSLVSPHPLPLGLGGKGICHGALLNGSVEIDHAI
jgi:hypothetical protein